MEGKKILDNRCCPMYSVCAHCFGSGPVHMFCQKCRNKDEIYQIPKRNGKFLDTEWVLRFFGPSHLDVRADKTQNWQTQKIWDEPDECCGEGEK
jgi:hypothetical protein